MHNSSGALPVCDWQKAGMLSCQAAMLSIAAWQKAAKLLCFMNNSSGERKGTKNPVAGTEGKSSRGSEIHVTVSATKFCPFLSCPAVIWPCIKLHYTSKQINQCPCLPIQRASRLDHPVMS